MHPHQIAAAGAPGPPAPARRRATAVLVWLAIYPTITVLSWLLLPLLDTWPLPLRTATLTLIAVPTVVFVLLPALQRAYARLGRSGR